MNFIVGLGNPEDKYEGTRHNIGRDIVTAFAKKYKFDDFEYDKKLNAQISKGKIGRNPVTLILPDTYMNKSGNSLKKFITSAKKAEKMMVVQDDLDTGLGMRKIVFGRNSAGHRGIDSVVRAVKTKNFPRLKIGISPMTPGGKIKKPKGEEKVVKHVLGKFSPKEQDLLKKIKKDAVASLETFVTDGYLKAMNLWN
jgi:PTH1 family peptidyl-tRNA hydrolase